MSGVVWIAAGAVATWLLTAAFFATRRRAGTASLVAVLLGNALVSLSLLSALFLAGEAYYHWIYDTTDGMNLSRVSHRWFERHWQENRFGVRDDIEYPYQRTAGRRRITFVGDSFTAAQGINDVRNRFAHRVRQARAEWEVHAYARNGANAWEELQMVRGLVGAGYELDVVVLVYCFNDIDGMIPDFRKLFGGFEPPPAFLPPLQEHSFAIDVAYHRWLRSQRSRRSDGVDIAAVRLQAYEGPPFQKLAHIEKLLAKEVRDAGAQLLVVTFPWPERLLGDNDVEVMHERLAELWAGLAVPQLDLRESFADHAASELVVNRQDNHPSLLAHRLAADAILDFVDAQLLPGSEEGARGQRVAPSATSSTTR